MVHVFESCGFEYKVLRPIQHAHDGDPILLPPDSLEADGETRLLPGTQVETTPAIPLGLLATRLLHFGPKEVERAARKLPVGLRRIIAKSLQVDPSKRYPSALAMAEDLRGFLSDACPRYHEADIAAEKAKLIRAAKKLDGNVAYSVTEPGILPVESSWSVG